MLFTDECLYCGHVRAEHASGSCLARAISIDLRDGDRACTCTAFVEQHG